MPTPQPTRPEIGSWIRPVIRSGPAAVLFAAGFTGRSMKFTRSRGDFTQHVDFDFAVRPHYAGTGQSHLTLHLDQVIGGEILDTYRRVRPGDPDPQRACTTGAAIETVEHPPPPMWFFHDEKSARALEAPVVEAIEQKALPYLVASESPAELLRRTRASLPGFAAWVNWVPAAVVGFGVAVATVLGKRDEAVELYDEAVAMTAGLPGYDEIAAFLGLPAT